MSEGEAEGMTIGQLAVRKVLDGLRDSGHVVVVFTPEEVGDASPQRLADHMISRGWEFIECWTAHEHAGGN